MNMSTIIKVNIVGLILRGLAKLPTRKLESCVLYEASHEPINIFDDIRHVWYCLGHNRMDLICYIG